MRELSMRAKAKLCAAWERGINWPCTFHDNGWDCKQCPIEEHPCGTREEIRDRAAAYLAAHPSKKARLKAEVERLRAGLVSLKDWTPADEYVWSISELSQQIDAILAQPEGKEEGE